MLAFAKVNKMNIHLDCIKVWTYILWILVMNRKRSGHHRLLLGLATIRVPTCMPIPHLEGGFIRDSVLEGKNISSDLPTCDSKTRRDLPTPPLRSRVVPQNGHCPLAQFDPPAG